MLRSIYAECYKVTHRLYFWACMAVAALCSFGVIFCLCLIKTQAPGTTTLDLAAAMNYTILGLPVGLYLVIIGADMVFSEQYKYNTLKNEVSFGISRLRVYLSRWVAALLAMLLLYLVLAAAYVLFGAVLLGLPDPAYSLAHYQSTAGERLIFGFYMLGVYSFAAFPLWLGGLSLSIACLFLITNSTVASFTYVGILALLPGVLEYLGLYVNSLFTPLYHLTLTYYMDMLFTGSPGWAEIGQCWLVGLGWTVVSTALGAALFARKEIK